MKLNETGKRLTAFAGALAALLMLVGCSYRTGPELTPLTVSLLRVGKADAIALCSGSHGLLIDAGEEDDGQEVVEFFRERGITELDAMIITHFDRDHVGGADTVLERLPVERVYVPDYEGTHQEYLDFLAAAEQAAVPLQRLTQPERLWFGSAQVLIEPPASYEIPDGAEEFDNNFSLITTVQHGENRLVFMGDAEKQRIRQWLADSRPEPCDFLKVPHHGIYNKALEELFQTLSPRYSVICSSRKHPAEARTLELLKGYCPGIFETKDGDVTVISNGSMLEVRQKIKS